MDRIDIIYDLCERSLNKIDHIEEMVQLIDKRTDANTLDLAEHMRRSKANEKRLELLEQRSTLSWWVKTISTGIISLSVLTGAIAKILGYL